MIHASSEIVRVMTPASAVVSTTLQASEALRLAREHNMSFLPVTEAQRLVAVVDRADLVALERVPGFAQRRVEDVARFDPFTCGPNSCLRDTLEMMRRQRLDVLVVVDSGRPVGLFGADDVLRLLEHILGNRSRAA